MDEVRPGTYPRGGSRTAAAAALVAALFAAMGCRAPSSGSTEEAFRAPQGTLLLDGAWREVAPPDGTPPGALYREARFSLGSEQLGGASALVLEDPWWRVQVSVNGTAAGEVTGGLGPVSLPVGEHLVEGENRITAVVSEPPRTGAGAVARLRTNGERRDAELGEGTHLSLRAEGHLVDVALASEGDQVRAVARVAGAPRGARVSAAAYLDGERIQDLGSADVVDGVATLPAATWEGERWSPLRQDEGGLVHVLAQLEDRHGGVLHRMSRRAGVREMTVSTEGFALDGKPFPLLADRIQNHVAPHSQLAEVSAAGINALEAHGHLPSSAWLDEADELGLPVVVLPRCVGAIWGGRPADQWAELDQLSKELASQDEAAAWAMAGHPSVLLWACEGTPNVAARMCEGIERLDPADIPIAGVDVASRSIGGVARSRQPGTVEPSPAWIVEIGKVEGTHGIRDIAEHFAEASGGIYGGVALSAPPRAQDVDEWRNSWSDVADSMGAKTPVASDRRARSRLRVTGLAPGETVWLEAPGIAPLGTVASDRGVAVFDLWHAGEATLTAGGTTHTVTLEPDRWKHLKRVSNQVQFSPPR